jgi:hypothetical protein
MIDKACHKVSGFAFECLDFRIGDDVDVEMPADLDQFRRDNSHGTIIGRKGLIQLRHQPSDARGPIHQMDIVACIGQIQSRLHAGNARTNHHDSSNLLNIFQSIHIIPLSLQD